MKIKSISLLIGLIAFQSSLVASLQDADVPFLHERKESRLKKLICSPVGCICSIILGAAALTAITLAIHPITSNNNVVPSPLPSCNNTISLCNATDIQTQTKVPNNAKERPNNLSEMQNKKKYQSDKKNPKKHKKAPLMSNHSKNSKKTIV